MKKILLAGALLLIAAACNQTTTSPSQNVSVPAPTTQTYTNATYGFQFTYPLSMSFVSPSYGNLADKIVQLQIPQSAYPKTNFADAAFAVSASYEKTLQNCLTDTPPENGNGFKSQTTINGINFYTTNATGVGAGNIYQSKIYRAYVGTQTCIELGETIHTGNIGNYTPGTVTEVDQTPIWSTLDQITQSFTFTK